MVTRSLKIRKNPLAGNLSNLEKMLPGLTAIPSLTYLIVEKVSLILITPEYNCLADVSYSYDHIYTTVMLPLCI
jgi:hypothetical protein